MARLTATVVLPTPPLPEPTAMILETPGKATGEGMAGEWAIGFDCSFNRPCVNEIRLLRVVRLRLAIDDRNPPMRAGEAVCIKFYRSWGSSFSVGLNDGAMSTPATRARMEWICRTPSV